MNSPELLASPQSHAPAQSATPGCFFYSSPVQLRAVAHLYGIETVPVSKARILEIGCGIGENLMPLALGYPDAEIVGLESSPDKVARANEAALAVGATNLQFHLTSALESSALGEFDYIVMHELYSKVPTAVGQTLLAACRNYLSPKGIAYVSYNTLPGWKVSEIVRDAMLLRGHSATNLQENLAAGRAMLSFLSEGMAASNPLADGLIPMLHQASALSDEELAEYLRGDTAPCYFVEFADRARQAGLSYIGDAQPEQEIPLTYGNNVSLFHSLNSLGQTPVMRQQYLDFAVGRQGRKSLLARDDGESARDGLLDLSRLADLRYAGHFSRNAADLQRGGVEGRFLNQLGRSYVTDDENVRRIMGVLTSVWPCSLSFGELAALMPGHAYLDEKQSRKQLLQALEPLFRAGMLRYCLDATPYDTAAERALTLTRNAAAALKGAASQADRKTAVNTYSFWHEPVVLNLDEEDLRMLTDPHALDADGRWHWDGKDVFEFATEGLRAKTLTLLERLRRAGLISGSPAAWAQLARLRMLSHQGKGREWIAHTDMLLVQYDRALAAGAGIVRTVAHPPKQDIERVYKLRRDGDFGAAESSAKALADRFPFSPDGWNALGHVYAVQHREDDAIPPLLRAIALNPSLDTAYAQLGYLFHENGELQRAEICFARAARFDPKAYQHRNNLGNVLRRAGRLTDARLCLESALPLADGHRHTCTNLGLVLSELGLHADAEKNYLRALDIDPHYHLAHSNLLFLLTHRVDMEPMEVFEHHRKFGELVTKRGNSMMKLRHANDKDPERRLRIGFVSGDLRNHAVMNFLEPIWRALNTDSFEIYAYHNSPTEDAVSRRARKLTAEWRQVSRQKDTELAKAINSDRVDILFDLSGHTALNRLPMFALKPAPVQLSWIGYPGTTGLAEMDYYLVDRHVAPPGFLDAQFTEKLVYLPSAGTFQPFEGSPAVNGLPAERNGYITFGSFNRYNKLSDQVLALWSQVLAAVPDARMLLGGITDFALRSDLTRRLGKYGVAADRLIFRPRAAMAEYLGFHHDVDIALDTFPYTGGTTTHHSLWMGVPVLSMRGRTRVECQTAGALGRAGLGEWVCDNQDQFVRKAVEWAENIEALASLRAGMREKLLNAPDRDPRNVTRGLERAMREMWRIWCNGEAPRSFTVDHE
ncbi:O-linked N-acetylglucosamine transferase family protein [Bordetella genomosp. 9]|uniref:O-linked N-acetylglucosamine transferase family protein n=1 Tax=Bordetella genomosp. 9 TaxID=1416803 RepID=UPI0018DF5CBC|nr:methyltransferase regulatory domain-containing protein [Bordetella genomosp. 9]